MVRDPHGDRRGPEPEAVFDTLDDPACREIVSAIDEPMTASEVSDASDVPLSTTYKKLDKLEASRLVAERTEIRQGGHHRSRYVVDFDRLVVALDETRDFAVQIESPETMPERRLVDIWASVREEV